MTLLRWKFFSNFVALSEYPNFKRTLMKWLAHLLLVSLWLFCCLLSLAFAISLLVGMFYLIYGLMGIAGVVVILLWILVTSVILSILQLKKEGRCPGHFNFLVKFCNSLQSFCESLESNW